jgi:chemotaxis signal transduction protein
VLAVNQRYLAGLAKLDERLMIILDIDRLFEAEELAATVSPAPMVSA